METPSEGPRGSTPSQTAGPFLTLGLAWPDGPAVVTEGTQDAVWIRGTIYDGAAEPVPDALVETWQADTCGHFDHPEDPDRRAGFRGFGRCATDDAGGYAVLTVLPGVVAAPDGTEQARHLDVSVFARGLQHRVVTRVYFPEDSAAHAADPVLAAVPARRRHTLVAGRDDGGYRFDVHLQGERETVFFDV